VDVGRGTEDAVFEGEQLSGLAANHVTFIGR
jgi:hypothetical protein